MMIKKLVMISLLSSMSCGCATSLGLISKTDKAMPYFGTQFDVHFLTQPNELYRSHPLLLCVAYPAALIDLPLSMIADTLVYPYMSQGTKSAETIKK